MSPLENPSRQVLEETPGRVLTFLRGASTCVPIYATLETVGYGKAVTAKAWSLLHTACDYERVPSAVQMDRRILGAITELDAWDEPNLARIEAITANEHPDLYDAMMKNLEPATGAGSVLVVARVLDRLDGFEQGTTAEKALVATLAQRGYDQKERQRLRALVNTAKEAPDVPPARAPEANEAQTQELVALYRWWREWSQAARTLIKRRDHLLRLGLAKRQYNQDDPTP